MRWTERGQLKTKKVAKRAVVETENSDVDSDSTLIVGKKRKAQALQVQ
jgi:hypothetical protein